MRDQQLATLASLGALSISAALLVASRRRKPDDDDEDDAPFAPLTASPRLERLETLVLERGVPGSKDYRVHVIEPCAAATSAREVSLCGAACKIKGAKLSI